METIKAKTTTKPEVLLDKIHAEFPDLIWERFEFITDGWDHEVIILDSKLVFRFPNDGEYVNALANEIHVLGQLQSLVHANIPNYTYIAKDSSFAGYPIVPGEIITTEVFGKLDRDTTQNIAKQLADLLTSLHTAGDRGMDVSSVPTSYMPGEQLEVRKLAAKCLPTMLSEEDYKTVESILQDTDRLLAQPTPTRFIHGDVYSSHLLWDGLTQKLGLIDFSDMAIADPAIDFAELYEYGRTFVEMVYEYYKAPKDERFLKRAWVYRRWVGVYMMTDYFMHHKTSFEVARETFERVKATKA